MLKSVLRAEEAARLSDETQAAYAAAEREEGDSDWLEVTGRLQRRVLREHGVPPERMAAALFATRSAAALFPHDAELRGISLYVRHNRAQRGSLVAGDQLPDVPLYPPEPSMAATSLRAVCAGEQPTLLVAGSWT